LNDGPRQQTSICCISCPCLYTCGLPRTSGRFPFHNITGLYYLDALPVRQHGTGVVLAGAIALETNTASILLLLDAAMHNHYGGHPAMHYPRTCCRFSCRICVSPGSTPVCGVTTLSHVTNHISRQQGYNRAVKSAVVNSKTQDFPHRLHPLGSRALSALLGP